MNLRTCFQVSLKYKVVHSSAMWHSSLFSVLLRLGFAIVRRFLLEIRACAVGCATRRRTVGNRVTPSLHVFVCTLYTRVRSRIRNWCNCTAVYIGVHQIWVNLHWRRALRCRFRTSVTSYEQMVRVLRGRQVINWCKKLFDCVVCCRPAFRCNTKLCME
jgi:hypothetical protein